MDATFLEKLRSDYPELIFRKGRRFSFRPPNIVFMGPDESHGELLLLHEIGHALLGHYSFNTAAKRLGMECAAWEKARELAIKYNIVFIDEVMDAELNTYRDWFDKKSRCPECGLARFQTPDGQFHCPKCENLN